MNLLYNPPSCYAARTASQSITHATITSIAFNATDVWDTAALHDPSVIPERITIPTGGDGVYLFTGTVTWTADVNGSVRIQYISKNGTPLIGSVVPLVTGSGICATQVALQVKVAAGDYVEFQVFQDAGHSLNVDSAQFQATRIAIG
jgi:hypothetical protein